MKNKLKEILWLIRAYISQPFIPTVSVQYVLDKVCSYTANDYMRDDYVYYWDGDFKTGKQVKVRSIDLLRYEYDKLKVESDSKKDIILELVSQVDTHDLGENFVKNEIINILKDKL